MVPHDDLNQVVACVCEQNINLAGVVDFLINKESHEAKILFDSINQIALIWFLGINTKHIILLISIIDFVFFKSFWMLVKI